MSAKNFMSYGDAETVFTAIANAIKNNEDAVAAVTSALAAIKDGTELDSFGDVEVALLDKADTSDLGTAAAKDSTNSVTAGSTDLVESGAVKDAIDAAVAAAYHHAGTKTVAQLTHDLLIAANEGNVYNITDSGTTTSDFIEGIGKPIDAGDNVGICKVGNVYMFDLLSGLEDTSGFVRKSQTSGLLKNDGTVNTTIEDTVAGHTAALAGKVDKVDGKGLSTNDFTDTYKDKVDNNTGAIEAIVNEYGAKNLLPNRATSQTLNGVTFTVNTDGSVTVNGTATARIDFNIARQDVDGFHLGSGNYIINGCPADGGSESYHLLMSVNNTWGTKDVGQGVTVNGTIEAVVIRVMSGVKIDNKTFYPMVRDARISDDTYVPYAMTNRELTGAVDQLKSGLTNVDTVTVTTNHQSITTSTVYAKKLGKILLVSGYFYVASGQDIPKDTLLFTVGQSTLSDVFTSLVSSDGDVTRLKMATNGEIYSEYTFKTDRFYSFEMVAFTN